MRDDAYPTELAGVAELHTESMQAWGLDYGEADVPTQRLAPRRITAAALAGSLVLVAAAGVVAVLAIRGVWDIPELTAAAPAVSTPTTAPPAPTATARAQPLPPGPWITPTKPVTVTVQAPPPPTIAQIPPTAAYDQQFLAQLRSEGWTITSSTAMTNNAHIVCAAFQRGVAPEIVNGDLMTNAGMNTTEALLFSSAAMMVYPNCR